MSVANVRLPGARLRAASYSRTPRAMTGNSSGEGRAWTQEAALFLGARLRVLVAQAAGRDRQKHAAGQLTVEERRVLALGEKRFRRDLPAVPTVKDHEVGRRA